MPIQCQKECPIWGVVKKENFSQYRQLTVIVIQNSCQVALGLDPSPARQLCFALFQRHILDVSVPARKYNFQFLIERESLLSELEEGWFIYREFSTPNSCLVCLCKWGLQILSLFKKALSWLVRVELLWLFGEDADRVVVGGRIKLCSSDWTGKVSILLVEIPFQELLHKVWAQMTGTVQVGSSVQTSP